MSEFDRARREIEEKRELEVKWALEVKARRAKEQQILLLEEEIRKRKQEEAERVRLLAEQNFEEVKEFALALLRQINTELFDGRGRVVKWKPKTYEYTDSFSWEESRSEGEIVKVTEYLDVEVEVLETHLVVPGFKRRISIYRPINTNTVYVRRSDEGIFKLGEDNAISYEYIDIEVLREQFPQHPAAALEMMRYKSMRYIGDKNIISLVQEPEEIRKLLRSRAIANAVDLHGDYFREHTDSLIT